MGRPNAEQLEKLAYEIKDFMIRNELWMDTRIFFNRKALSTDDGHGHSAYNNPSINYIINPIDPSDYFDYAGDGILCMSFEGPMYDLMNCYVPTDYYNVLEAEFRGILRKYGLSYELGNAWNLYTFEI